MRQEVTHTCFMLLFEKFRCDKRRLTFLEEVVELWKVSSGCEGVEIKNDQKYFGEVPWERESFQYPI